MRLKPLLAVAAMLSTTLIARADLTGNSVTATESLYGTTYNLGTFIVPGAVIGHDQVADFYVSGSMIDLTFNVDATFPAGTTFTFTDNTGPTGISSIVLASSNVPGLTASDVSYTSNAVTFNLSRLTATTSESAVFDLNFGAASTVTPEPSSLALLGTGILGVAGAARRRFARS